MRHDSDMTPEIRQIISPTMAQLARGAEIVHAGADQPRDY
jgi:hypothetical protein